MDGGEGACIGEKHYGVTKGAEIHWTGGLVPLKAWQQGRSINANSLLFNNLKGPSPPARIVVVVMSRE